MPNGHAPGHMLPRDCPLETITLDEELQPRAAPDDDLLESLRESLENDEVLPPIIVFDDGRRLWLADGFHRLHVHKELGLTSITCTVIPGTRDDALRYSLSANARHGKPPNDSDRRRAYHIAVAHSFVNPTDVAGVAALLHCSERWARTLTEEVRSRADAKRNAEIIRLKGEGRSNRDVARTMSIHHRTVANVTGNGEKRKSSKIRQPGPDCAGKQEVTHHLRTDHLPDPWDRVREAILAFNALPDVESLFANEPHRFDPELAREIGKGRSLDCLAAEEVYL